MVPGRKEVAAQRDYVGECRGDRNVERKEEVRREMPGAVLFSNLETAVVVVTGEAVPLAF